MAEVVFWEKPGCAGNARQKALLLASGHRVEVRSLLAEPWTADRLAGFFGARPVADWFNRSSPRVKSGEIVPETMTAAAALAAMLADPLLVRRPLIEVAGRREVGFDVDLIDAWIGLSHDRPVPGEGCARAAGEVPLPGSCPTPSDGTA